MSIQKWSFLPKKQSHDCLSSLPGKGFWAEVHCVGIQMVPSGFADLRRPSSVMPMWLEFDSKISEKRQVHRALGI